MGGVAVDLDAIRRRLDEERRSLSHSGDAPEVRPLVTRGSSRAWGQYWIAYSRLNESNADGAFAEEIEHHRSLGRPFEWKVYGHDRPADLKERLERRGFVIGEREAVLVLDLADAPAWVDAPLGVEVLRLARVEQIDMYRTVAEAVFGTDYSMTSGKLADAIRAGNRNPLGYVAMCDGEPASIGRLYTHPDSHFGGLYGGATIERFRGRGLYRALVAARARDAREFGAKHLVVDALPTSRPILERLGFVHLTDTWPCEWTPQV
jgi:hypothetical protein